MPPSPTRRRSAAAADGAVTLAMVAEAAGVSPSTVSRILNGTAKVSADKQQAVDQAIARLGFQPNPVARGLAGGRTMSIGVLTQVISSPFYGEAVHGIEDCLEREGYIPIFVSGHWHEGEERKALDALLARRVDGLIVLAGRLPDGELQRYAQTVPMVVIGRELRGPQLFSFGFDNRAGALLATRHLVEQGHRDIAMITGDPGHEDSAERLAGYRQALEQAGIRPDPALLAQGDYTEAGGLRAVHALLDAGRRFSAVFAANDQTALGAALGLYRRGLRVPEDISLVGFDDLALAEFAIPPLSTVRLSVHEVGRQAAAAMLDLLRGQAPRVRLPAPKLVRRESVRRLRARGGA